MFFNRYNRRRRYCWWIAIENTPGYDHQTNTIWLLLLLLIIWTGLLCYSTIGILIFTPFLKIFLTTLPEHRVSSSQSVLWQSIYLDSAHLTLTSLGRIFSIDCDFYMCCTYDFSDHLCVQKLVLIDLFTKWLVWNVEWSKDNFIYFCSWFLVAKRCMMLYYHLDF